MELAWSNIENFEIPIDKARDRGVKVNFGAFAEVIDAMNLNDIEAAVLLPIYIETKEHRAFVHDIEEMFVIYGCLLPYRIIRCAIDSLAEKGAIYKLSPYKHGTCVCISRF